MDDSAHLPTNSPGYETSDANAGGVLAFIGALALVLVAVLVTTWALFRYYNATENARASSSPFSTIRQIPPAPQLQPYPRQDLLNLRAEQEKTLETYGWENREAGTVRIPIDRAMDLMLQRGFPVLNAQAPSKEPAGQVK